MKRFVLFAHVATCWTFAAFTTLQAQDPLSAYPNYVVIGAFAVHKNAINFTGEANKQSFPARYEMNQNRHLYYVYVLATEDRERAFAEAVRLRTDTKYFDAWVYSGPIGMNADGPGVDFNPETGQAIQRTDIGGSDGSELSADARGPLAVSAQQANATLSLSAAGDVSTGDTPGVVAHDESVQPHANDSATTTGSAPVRASTEPLTAEEVEGKNFYFHLFRADNLRMIDGEVDAIDVEKSRKMATYNANTSVKVMMPAGKTKEMSFVCQVFGYRKQQIQFDPAKPSGDFYLDDQGSLVIPFELMRLQKGDIAIMFNVFFFKDAAVMRPESRYEVNNLLELLQENPSYRIRIHGHTNGNASGKIIRMETPGNFYSLTGTRQGFGSAKELSEERANVIKEFLVHSGVEADRMEVKAWGGKKPIHDKHSVRANENVRVEIEILSD